MAAQGFIARVSGKLQQVFGIQTSAGAADGGKIPALDDTGRLSTTMMPVGFGQDTYQATASEALAAGAFVNTWSNAEVFSARLADNSNNREATGYVIAAAASGASATTYPLDGVNTGRSGMTVGADQWLGTSGGTISTPLNPSTDTGKTCQYLGRARSATELVTVDSDPVRL